ncbi:uncharacterized protein C18orf19 homolog A-like [Saccostrea echinata]|uniref:uncharacterized protein C18orf19 homolog A-like n=1 Tax=Saccostrea echinata TaxID=191078 RepID=UPI002A811EDF|nr:uncharacterized protein C18orf19 homolog A-like [Saccostrea echinata]
MHQFKSNMCLLNSVLRNGSHLGILNQKMPMTVRLCGSHFGTSTACASFKGCASRLFTQIPILNIRTCTPHGIRCLHVINGAYTSKNTTACNNSFPALLNTINVTHVNIDNRSFATSVLLLCEKKLDLSQEKSSENTTNEDVSNQETSTNSENVEAQLTQRQKLKRAVKEYGPVVIIFHICIALMSLGFFYFLVSVGVDVVGILRKLGVSEQILESALAAGASTFVIAYAVHKMFAVPRIGITLTCAPIIVRKLRKIGIFKPPKPSIKK